MKHEEDGDRGKEGSGNQAAHCFSTHPGSRSNCFDA